MRWLLAPDSFKGCLSASAVAQAMALGLGRADAQAVCTMKPMADGGEGTLEVLSSSSGGVWRHFAAQDAEGRDIEAGCLFLADGTAVIEVARVIGLGMLGDSSIEQRSSFGVGQLMRACMDAGATRLALALGGSATNDGGAGCLQALGVRLQDQQGQSLSGRPDELARLRRIERDGLDPRLGKLSLEIWSDVNLPLLGARGASHVFAAQKGASERQVQTLEGILTQWAKLADRAWGQEVSKRAGGGAAGGLGYALQLLGGRLESGAQAVARRIGLAEAIARNDWVLTGEGRGDIQTLAGQAPSHVARLARSAHVPVSLVCGSVQGAADLNVLFDGCFSICARPLHLSEAIAQAETLIAQTCEQLARALLAARR